MENLWEQAVLMIIRTYVERTLEATLLWLASSIAFHAAATTIGYYWTIQVSSHSAGVVVEGQAGAETGNIVWEREERMAGGIDPPSLSVFPITPGNGRLLIFRLREEP